MDDTELEHALTMEGLGESTEAQTVGNKVISIHRNNICNATKP